MHELSVALEVCRLAEGYLDGRIEHLRRVGLEVGKDAGIEVGNLQFCLETLLAEPPFGQAVLDILVGEGDALHLRYLEVDDGHPAH